MKAWPALQAAWDCLSLRVNLFQRLRDGSADALAAKLVQVPLNLRHKLRIRGCKLSEDGARGQGKVGVGSARIEKSLEAAEQRIGDGQGASIFIAAAQIVEPTGDDEGQDARRLRCREKIRERRHEKLGHLGAAVGADARQLIANRGVGETLDDVGGVIVKIDAGKLLEGGRTSAMNSINNLFKSGSPAAWAI